MASHGVFADVQFFLNDYRKTERCLGFKDNNAHIQCFFPHLLHGLLGGANHDTAVRITLSVAIKIVGLTDLGLFFEFCKALAGTVISV
jgi:hypothetical protein